uniref:Reverse transcriptase domain-containing protein n=1 Tax=Tanacetum cinerariifolium TaxID=118510 RepID=A0A6L2MAH1_TANCI|nr:reverse transcriptase domain-containing protein [Tanacetum cinerariifolium]
MQTRSSSRLVSNPSSNPTPSTNQNPKGCNRRRSKQRIKELNLDELSSPIVTMADQRTMAQLLQAPTEGYEDAIVVPAITVDNFELKHDQDSLNSAAGGNFLDKMPRECLAIIESKSKVHYSRNKLVVAKVSTNTSTFAYQAPVYQAPAPQTQGVSKEDFSAYVKANDAVMRNMQTQATSLLTRSDLKEITTHSGVSYDGPQIPSLPSFLLKVMDNEPEVTKDTVHPTNNGSTEDVQPQVVQFKYPILTFKPVNSPIIEPVASPDLNFNISFADALILMPKFGPSIKILLTNKDKLCELARTPLNKHYLAVLLKKLPKKLGDPGKLIPCDFPGKAECLALADLGSSINIMPLSVWNKLSLPDLSPTCMTLELTDRSISRPVRVAEEVYVKVGTFHFPADFVVVDFDADPRVPLILGRSFLKTGRALIDVFEGELTLRVGKKAITFNLDQTSRYSANYNDMTAKQIDFIDKACEEYSQEVLGFSDVIMSGNPTPYYDPIVSTTSSTLTSFGNSDFFLEEVDAFLALEDDPTSPERLNSKTYLFTSNTHFLEGDDSFPVIIAKDFSVEEKTALITVLKSHKRAIAWKLSDIKGIDPEFCTHKIIMEEDFEPMVHKRLLKNSQADDPSLKKDTLFIFSKECVKAFQTLKRKLTEVSILIALDWDMPFKLMCDASDFAIGAVLGQRQDKHFRPIHYASKTMTEAKSNYTTMEKEMLAVVYAFEKFRSYLIMNKSIVYTDHSALKYLFAKKDSNARLLRWVLLLQEFTFKVINKKRAENLAADHLSRLENPHQNVLDPKEINESFLSRHSIWFLLVSSEGVYMAKKPLTFLRLATMDPPGDTMAQITQPKRFGTPRAIISDRGTHFCNDQFAKVMQKFGVTHRLATPYHPQTSGQVEVSNRGLKRIFERTVGENRTAGDHKNVQLNELNELHDQAYENSLIYKEKTKRLHDSKIKDRVFNIGDRVLFNSRLKIFSDKLKSRWSGPFTISHVYPYGTVELA